MGQMQNLLANSIQLGTRKLACAQPLDEDCRSCMQATRNPNKRCGGSNDQVGSGRDAPQTKKPAVTKTVLKSPTMELNTWGIIRILDIGVITSRGVPWVPEPN